MNEMRHKAGPIISMDGLPKNRDHLGGLFLKG